MSSAISSFVVVDWGTSSFRGWLMAADGAALAETRGGEGMLHCAGGVGFAPVLRDHLGRLGAPAGAPVLICGMAGARQGWIEAPYLKVPTRLDALHEGAVRIDAPGDIRILPGVAQARADRPDVMRGEETQLFGAQALDGTMSLGKQLVCMPGTHTKWVSMNGSVVQEFLTAPTGELFAMLCDHSVLVRDPSTPVEHHPRDFERGLAESARHPEASLLHRLFQSRSLRLDKQLSPEGAASWTSGLLIGTDVRGALSLFSHHDAGSPVYVIGAPKLTASYAVALARNGRKSVEIDGAKAALAGLGHVYREQERAS